MLTLICAAGVVMIGVSLRSLRATECHTDICLDAWGFADVEAAVGAIVSWVETVGWDGPSVDTCGWLVIGHSNGGK